MYCIYRATNLINKKVYIGKTNNLSKRIREHVQDRRGNHIFHRAIQKYGEKNFKWEVLEDGIETNELASEREKYWISKSCSYFRDYPENGYNMTLGGDGGSCWNVRRVASYDLNGCLEQVFGTLTDAAEFYNISGTSSLSRACKDIRLTCKGHRFQYTFGAPARHIEVPDRVNARCRPIKQFTADGEFVKEYKCISDAESDGYRRSGVIGCANGTYKTSSGFIWRYSDDSSPVNCVSPMMAYREAKILRFDLLDNYIDSFCSCSDAARKCGIKSNKVIHKALTSKTHISNGYKWYKSSDVNKPIPR